MYYKRPQRKHKDSEIRRLLFVIYLMQGYDRVWIQRELNIGRRTYFNYKKFAHQEFGIKSQ